MSAPSSPDLTFRQPCAEDRDAIFKLLSQLTHAPLLPQPLFERRLAEISSNLDHTIVVAEDRTRDRAVVASGTLLIERKLLRDAGLVGHIEDVVVDKTIRGRGVGEAIVRRLVDMAKEKGCYKVILDCSDENVRFYERCGFKRKEVHMAKYFWNTGE